MKKDSYKKGSVCPKNTDESFKEMKYPGASELASPSAKAEENDLKMNVDASMPKRIADNDTQQIGGLKAQKRKK